MTWITAVPGGAPEITLMPGAAGLRKVKRYLDQYIAALSQTLNALKTNLDGRGTRLSESQITCQQEAKLVLEAADLHLEL